MGQPLEDREVGQRRQQATGHHHLLAADAVRQPAEHHEERSGDGQADGDQDVRRGRVDLQRRGEEEQGVELAGVPDHRLAGGGAEQGQDHHLEIAPAAESLGQRRLGLLALGLHLLEQRRLVQLQADIHRDGQQQRGHQERDAPAPAVETLLHGQAAGQDHQQRQEQAAGGGDLDEAGVEAAVFVGRVLGHISRRAAVFAAQGQPLQHAQGDQDDRRRHADAGVAGQHTDQEGRQAHDDDGDEEGVFAAHQVAEAAEHQGAEGAYREARGEGQQGGDVGAGFVEAGEELLGDDRRQRAVEVEVVPLEHGAQRGGENHPSHAGIAPCIAAPHRSRRVIHGSPPSCCGPLVGRTIARLRPK